MVQAVVLALETARLVAPTRVDTSNQRADMSVHAQGLSDVQLLQPAHTSSLRSAENTY